MPKILRILNRLNVGGPTYNVACLSKYINDDYETKVLAGFKEPNEGSSEYVLNALDIPFTYVPSMHRSINFKNDLKAYRYIKQIIDEYQPDIVHTHAAKAGLLGRLAARHSKHKPRVVVHTYHGNVFEGYFSSLKSKLLLVIERYLCSISTAIIAISEQQKLQLAHKYRIAAERKINTIKLGFDLEKFAEPAEQKREEFRRFYDIPDDVIVITITGRLTAIKNHALFISALGLLKKENPELKFKAFIVGDGELLEPIINSVKENGLTYNRAEEQHYDVDVIFTSWRKDIDVINAGSDIVVLTSINEGTPVSIIEAMASGKCVVSTDVGGVTDVITDGVTGYVSAQNAIEFSAKLKILISDGNTRLAMAAKGKKHALEKYSYKRLVKEIEELYNILLNE